MNEGRRRSDDIARGAVIDIGSNSVRLVIFEGPARCPIQVFNEKTLCGLGERDRETGRLRDEAIAEALATLRRFRVILDAAEADELYVFATAAAREAPNGPEFLAMVEETGFTPQLLSGEEEARLAAYGILSGAPDVLDNPAGALAGDIGGGSLELSQIEPSVDGWIGNSVSLPLGALRLSVEFEDDRDAAREHIRKTIEEIEWLKAMRGNTLYVVGGAWRGLAKIAIAQSDYPIDILDRYRLSRREVSRLCQVVSQQSAASLASMPVVQRRRAPTLPFAAMVLDAVLAASKVDGIEIASSGVREGILFAGLPPHIQRQDPLIEAARHLATRFGSHLRPPAAPLAAQLFSLFQNADQRQRRWIRAAAELANFSAGLEPAERAPHAAHAIMALPLKGLNHEGRVFLSAALAGRHGARAEELEEWLPMWLLDETRTAEAAALGLALRFLASLTPAGGRVMTDGKFVIADGKLSFELPAEYRSVWGATPTKRFDRLATGLGLEAVQPV